MEHALSSTGGPQQSGHQAWTRFVRLLRECPLLVCGWRGPSDILAVLTHAPLRPQSRSRKSKPEFMGARKTSPFLPSVSLQRPLQTGLTIVLTEREKYRVQSGITGQVLKVNADLMSVFSATQLSCTILHLSELPCCIPTDNIYLFLKATFSGLPSWCTGPNAGGLGSISGQGTRVRIRITPQIRFCSLI